MKKYLGKLIFIVFILIFVCSVSVYANQTELEIQIPQKSKEFERWENLSEEERKNTIQPFYSNITIKESVKRSTYSNLLKSVKSSTAETKFDLRDVLQSINVKNQQRVGSCWAFSYTSVLETTLANQNGKISNEYSPMHMDYKTAKMFNRKLGEGGTLLMEMAYSANRYGPVYEEDLSFDSVYDETENPATNYYLSDLNSVSTDQVAKAKIEEMPIIAMINKEYTDTSVTYTSGETVYSNEEIKAQRELIKKHIKENGAVTTTFYSDIGTTASDEYISPGNFYNSETSAYYCNEPSKQVNHAVTIVGWDDEYKKENFIESNRPLNDGAYIVLNSYGEDFGDDGYFYVSYDDAFIESAILGISSVKEYNENTKEADYIYQYDELGVTDALSWGTSSVYAANVFSRQDTTVTEYLSEVGIYLLSTEGVEIYVSTDGTLTNIGNPVASYTGSNALEVGYHTVKLSSPVKLTGNKFAVIVKYVNAESASVPMEINLKDSGFSYVSTAYDTATSNEGESYISMDGSAWYDIYNLKVNYINTLKNTNVCIKAFTTKVVEEENEEIPDEEKNVAVTGVKLNKSTEIMQVGDKLSLVATIEPTGATNKNVKWTTSNSNVATITEEGIITAVAEGETTITVTTEDGNYTASCDITVTKKTNSEDDIYKDDTEDKNNGQTDPSDTEVTNPKVDDTVADKIIPKAGSKITIITIVIVSIVGIIFYKKYKGYSDVK